MQGLDRDAQSRMLSALTYHAVAKHELINLEGHPVTHVHIVVRGAAMAWRNRSGNHAQVVGFLFPGDVLGAFAGATQQASARAIAPGTLASLPADRLGELIDQYTSLRHALYRSVSTEFALAQDHLMVLGAMSAAERLAATLLQLDRRQQARGYRPEVPLWLPMRRTDLASYLGLELPTLSRTFGRLRAANLITCKSSSEVLLRDRRELAELAGDAFEETARSA